MFIKILIIEDNADLRDTFKERFEEMGHFVLLAENGKIGLEVLSKEIVDLVLTDIQMPIMTDMEFLKQARELFKTLPPIVVMTGGSPYTIKEIYEAGATACYSKTGLTVAKVISATKKCDVVHF